MIVGFIGKMGSGKTLSMVRETTKYVNQGYKIFSNIHLNFPYTPFGFDDLFKMAEENDTSLNNVVMLLDEAHIMLDSRSGMKKSSKLISFWVRPS